MKPIKVSYQEYTFSADEQIMYMLSQKLITKAQAVNETKKRFILELSLSEIECKFSDIKSI